MSLNVPLLRSSFELVVERQPQLTHQILFDRNSSAAQEKMLTDALVAVMDHLEDAPWLTTTLKGLGAKHAGYGVTTEMYGWVGASLLATRDRVGVVHMGVLWVRVPPLTAVSATAPYLHNGSVPTLRALLQPAPQRPVAFSRGQTGFVFDTRLPGNRNIGYEYGVHLTPAEKDDLIAFLMSL